VTRPRPSVEQLRDALDMLGVAVCVEHAPSDPDEEAAGLLGAMLAAVQWQVQAVPEHAGTVDLAYHELRGHLGFPVCRCGSLNDFGSGLT
jgi:hypothetical protein